MIHLQKYKYYMQQTPSYDALLPIFQSAYGIL